MTSPARFDPDALAALESERDFLLRSIEDLESERAAGNLDDERYRALKDDYTARAAAVLRSIEEGREARPAPAPVSNKRRLLTGGAVLAFVAVAALALGAALGSRRQGETVTGNAQSSGAPSGDARRAALERQVQEHPDDAAAHLVYGRYLLETQDFTEAVKQYLAAAKLAPKNPEANAYAGWMLFQVAQSPNADARLRTELTDGALTRLDAAVAAAGNYPDSYFFRGLVRFRGKNDPRAAIPDFERYLALVPDGPLNAEVRQVLDQARQQAG